MGVERATEKGYPLTAHQNCKKTVTRVSTSFGWSDKVKAAQKNNRVFTNIEEKEDWSERNQPKVMAGSIRLPQVLNHGAPARDGNRMSYNFKQTIGEMGLEKTIERIDTCENMFLGVIKRPKMYSRIERNTVSSRQPSEFDMSSPEDPCKPRKEPEAISKKVRVSKSCPRPFSIDRTIQPSKIPIQALPDSQKNQNWSKVKQNGPVSYQDFSIRYLSFEDLAELKSPESTLNKMEALLSDDQEWTAQFNSLNDLRSLFKYHSALVLNNPNLPSILKKVCSFITSKRSGLAKNCLLVLQEALVKLGGEISKAAVNILQPLLSRISDANAFLTTEVEKCLELLTIHMQSNKILGMLMACSDHKSSQARCQVAKCLLKKIECMQKDIFLFKDYDRLLKCLATMSKDSNCEVRHAAKEAIKALCDLSDQPELIHKSISQHINPFPLHQKLSESFLRADDNSILKNRLEKKSGLKLKRLPSKKLANLNRTEELIKETPQTCMAKQSLLQSYIPDDGADSMQKSHITALKKPELIQRNKKAPQFMRHYTELDGLNDLMKDIDREDWQGKVEALATAVVIIKEHQNKFMRSIHLMKFFDTFNRLLEDPNQKLQQEALTNLKTDLRQAFSNLPERLLSLLVASLFKLQGANNNHIKQLSAECIINLRDYQDKKMLRTIINRQYVNLSIKSKANFAKFLADNAERIDASILELVHPVLTFNLKNAQCELKRLNELLFRSLLATHGDTLLSHFDEKEREQIRSIQASTSQ